MDKLEPAIYYGKLPKKFKRNVEFLRAVRFSIEGNKTIDLDFFDGTTFYEKEKLVKWVKPKLEKKIVEELKQVEGDLVLLDKPKAKITGYGDTIGVTANKNGKMCAGYVISVNGSLYKTNGVKTHFSRRTK